MVLNRRSSSRTVGALGVAVLVGLVPVSARVSASIQQPAGQVQGLDARVEKVVRESGLQPEAGDFRTIRVTGDHLPAIPVTLSVIRDTLLIRTVYRPTSKLTAEQVAVVQALQREPLTVAFIKNEVIVYTVTPVGSLDAAKLRSLVIDVTGALDAIAALMIAQAQPSDAPADDVPQTPERFKVGQMVEGWITAEWLPVKLVQLGGGPNPDSPYLVEVGAPIRGIQPKRWLGARDVRPLSKPLPPDAAAPGPRLGRYQILSYGNPSNPLRLGHIELVTGGIYRYHNAGGRLLGTGRYRFDLATSSVVWQDGLLEEQNWTGTFTIEREGKTHKIRLIRTTIAVNSID